MKKTQKAADGRELGGRDELTGVWNKMEAETRIAGSLCKGGALFLCDIDHMKRINEQYGHLAGDACLRQTARILGYLIRERDILGRTDGDEFVIFMPGCVEEVSARAVGQRMEERFAAGRKKEEGYRVSPISVGVAVSRRGEGISQLFQRAREELEKRQKELGQRQKAPGSRSGMQKGAGKDDYKRDARQVRQDLIEQIRKPGAYCRDYETFKSIYRFLERGIVRSRQKACVILLSVVDEEGGSVPPFEKDLLMERLGEKIRTTLRMGDVYTRYTSSQYLVLVIDTTENLADLIADRVRDKFLAEEDTRGLLVHYCYELQPARIWEMEAEWKEADQKSCL